MNEKKLHELNDEQLDTVSGGESLDDIYFDAYGADREDQYRCVKCGGKRGQHLTTCTWRYNDTLTDNCRACRYCRTSNYLGDVYKGSFNYCSICTYEGT